MRVERMAVVGDLLAAVGALDGGQERPPGRHYRRLACRSPSARPLLGAAAGTRRLTGEEEQRRALRVGERLAVAGYLGRRHRRLPRRRPTARSLQPASSSNRSRMSSTTRSRRRRATGWSGRPASTARRRWLEGWRCRRPKSCGDIDLPLLWISVVQGRSQPGGKCSAAQIDLGFRNPAETPKSRVRAKNCVVALRFVDKRVYVKLTRRVAPRSGSSHARHLSRPWRRLASGRATLSVRRVYRSAGSYTASRGMHGIAAGASGARGR